MLPTRVRSSSLLNCLPKSFGIVYLTSWSPASLHLGRITGPEYTGRARSRGDGRGNTAHAGLGSDTPGRSRRNLLRHPCCFVEGYCTIRQRACQGNVQAHRAHVKACPECLARSRSPARVGALCAAPSPSTSVAFIRGIGAGRVSRSASSAWRPEAPRHGRRFSSGIRRTAAPLGSQSGSPPRWCRF